MATSLVTCRTLDDFYHIDCRTFDKQYKEVLSGYRSWSEIGHADKWLVFPENIGGSRNLVGIPIYLCQPKKKELSVCHSMQVCPKEFDLCVERLRCRV